MKKLIACLLALCLTASVSALTFTDQAEIHRADEVAIFADLGLIVGSNGAFRPNDNIRRSEAAKLIALVCEADPHAAGKADFSDVSADFWAEKYIAYCSEKRIIVGSDGRFRPGDFVTGREFAKMLLVCVGNDAARYEGAAWAEAVDADAAEKGVYDGFFANPGRTLSREDACLLMYNAMQCSAVSGTDENGAPIYVLDDLMNPVTYMEYRFGVVKFRGVLIANEFADLTKRGGALEKGMSKLEGHTASEFSTSYLQLGRTVELTTVRSEQDGEAHYTVIGNPSLPGGEDVCEAHVASDYVIVLRYLGYSTNETTKYYLNGDPSDVDFLTRLGEDSTITGIDRNGDKVLDAVVAWSYETGTVVSGEPLEVSVGGVTKRAILLDEGKPIVGASVRCLLIDGRCYLP